MNRHEFIAFTSGCELIASVFGDNKTHGTAYGPHCRERAEFAALRLHRAPDGKYVAARIFPLKFSAPQNNYEAAVCADVIDVIEFFGDGKLALELYAAADKALGISN